MPFSAEEYSGLIRKSINCFVEEELSAESMHDIENSCGKIAAVLHKMLAKNGLGIGLLAVPEEYGGIGCGLPGLCAAGEALGRADLGIGTGALATLLVAAPVFGYGTEQQKKRVADIVMQGGIGAFAATEAQGGSAVADLRTQAVPVSGGAYRINGAKQWITNAGIADFCIVLAKAPGGPSWFILDKNSPGLTFGQPEKKHGQHLSITADVYLDNVHVPAENLLGLKEGEGLKQAASAFGLTRIIAGAMSLGAGQAALEDSLDYALSRYGGTLAENPAYMNGLIIPDYARLEAVRFYMEALSAFSFCGADLSAEACIAKFFAAEACVNACRASSQACGGAGISREYPAGKRLTDSLILPIYEGADEVLKISAFRHRWQEYLRSGGKLYLNRAGIIESDGKNGGSIAAETLRIVSLMLDMCRKYRLTRDKFLCLKIGEIIAFAEVSAAFSAVICSIEDGNSKNACSDPAFPLEINAEAALCRIFAREAFIKSVSEGLSLLSGASAGAGQDFLASAGDIGDLICRFSEGNLADFAISSTALLLYSKKSTGKNHAG